jgi:signal transduction histidine kinase
MMGASTLLTLDIGEKTQRVRTVADRIHRQAERMARMIDDLVDFAGIESGRLALERGKHDPAEIITAAREMFGPIAQERGLVFEVNVAKPLPQIDCDSERALQVISNLVANAFKVTPRGGQVSIGAAPQDREIVFFVKDTGPGIEAEELPNLFERFWRSKRPHYKGAGLGLSIARGIVDAHGGRIWAESQVGVGSTFYFSLSTLRNN